MRKFTQFRANMLVGVRNFFRPKNIYTQSANSPPEPSFKNRLAPLQRFIGVLIVFLLLWSALTECIFLFSGFLNITNAQNVSTVMTILFIFVLESCKFFLGKYCFRFITHAWLKDGGQYILAFSIVLPITVGVFYASIFLSVNGAPQVVEFAKNQTKIEFIVNKDSIDNKYDKMLVRVEADKESAKNTTWRGVTTTKATLLLQKYEDRIIDIELQRKQAINAAFSQKQEVEKLFSNDSEYWGIWFARFGGYGEALTLFFIFFMETYRRAVEKEKSLIYTERESERNDSVPERKESETEQIQEVTVENIHENIDDLPIDVLLQEPVSVPNNTDIVPEQIFEFEGKTYTEEQLKDFIRKTKYRAKNNRTENSRLQNEARLRDLLSVLDSYQKGE